MKQALFTITAIFGFILLSSCISSEESGADRQDPITREPIAPKAQSTQQSNQERPQDPSAPGRQAKQSNGSRLTSKQDTLVASITRRTSGPMRTARGVERPNNHAYTVQVGAFSKAQNALRYQKLAKERFARNSVHNVYEPRRKIYKVSIGKFTTHREAASLRHEIIRKYPTEYSQAWVNYITK